MFSICAFDCCPYIPRRNLTTEPRAAHQQEANNGGDKEKCFNKMTTQRAV